MMRSLFAMAFRFYIFFLRLAVTQVRDDYKPLTLCELLKNREHLNGKEVTVRGWLSATDEGLWLMSDCAEGFVAAGHRWPTHIWIVTARSDYRADDDFARARRAMDRLNRMLPRSASNHRRGNDRLWVTCIGTFETDPRL